MSAADKNLAWMQRPERGHEAWIKFVAFGAKTFGRRFTRLFLYPVAGWFWARTPAARQDSARYLRRVLNQPVTARHTFQHYLSFAATILDRMYFLQGRRDLFELEVFGRETLFDRLAEERGVFMVGAHMGSFESLRIMSRKHQQWRVSMAMFEENARQIGAVLRTVDPQLEEMIVPLGQMDSMLKIQARLDRGDMVGFLADRTIGQDTIQTLPFLGEPAPFPTGVFRMAAVLRRPVIVMAGLYLGKNRYRLHFVELADFTDTPRAQRQQAVSDAVKNYAGILEKFCHEAPFNWFNFYDFWAPPAKDEHP
ncbi:MAG: acyl-CoA synthetase [Burkholderiaceae bacterium]